MMTNTNKNETRAQNIDQRFLHVFALVSIGMQRKSEMNNSKFAVLFHIS